MSDKNEAELVRLRIVERRYNELLEALFGQPPNRSHGESGVFGDAMKRARYLRDFEERIQRAVKSLL